MPRRPELYMTKEEVEEDETWKECVDDGDSK